MIKKIDYTDTYSIRHQVMWPKEPLSYIMLEDDLVGDHFGYFVEDEMVSVISLFSIDSKVQFRKFATLFEHQGKGYGSALLKHVLCEYEGTDTKLIWCNARLEKTHYYERFGLEKTDETFERKNKKYVIMAKRI